MWFGVWGLGVWGFGGLGFGGLGFGVWGLGFRVRGLGFRLQGLGFRVDTDLESICSIKVKRLMFLESPSGWDLRLGPQGWGFGGWGLGFGRAKHKHSPGWRCPSSEGDAETAETCVG